MKDKIESSEQSVIKLKRHMENGTCPPDLRYDAKANIFPDEDFKSDIKAIRKEAEAWVALGKSFYLCRLKNHKNSKPQPEKKTFSPTEEGRISGS